jgi:hypothetical protein
MIQAPDMVLPSPRFRAGAFIAVVFLACSCDSSDRLAPTPKVNTDSPGGAPSDSTGGAPSDSIPGTPPTDSTASPPIDSTANPPIDSTGTPPADSGGSTPPDSVAVSMDTCPAMALASQNVSKTGIDASGIAFGAFDMPPTMMGSKFTGIARASGSYDVLCTLATARRAGARIIVRMSGGDRYFRNPDRTLNLEKWKARIDRYKRVSLLLQTFIDDGTLIGHYILDEPHNAETWKNQVPFEIVEEMARYSKELWPDLTTVVRAYPDWLSKASFRWQYLDAAWAQYSGRKGEVRQWMKDQSAYARSEGLGLFVGLNFLNGGDASSGIEGPREGAYSMSAQHIREWGAVLAADPYACAFYSWKYKGSYFDRPDIKSALEEVASKAANRERKSCKG